MPSFCRFKKYSCKSLSKVYIYFFKNKQLIMIKIKKGIDIHLVGEAKKEMKVYEPALYAIKPLDFIGV